MKYLNLGCGHRYHPDWTNINFTRTGKDVIVHDLTKGIPFPDNYFDVVYHSHVLEHFTRHNAKFLIKECQRVLHPQGILRVVVPDLEKSIRTYIQALELAKAGSQEWAKNYDWIMLQLLDQMVRTSSGGEMFVYLSQNSLPNKEFIVNCCGIEIKNIIELKDKPQSKLAKTIKDFLKPIYYSGFGREPLLKLILGKDYKALKIGRHRLSGEVHQWMYDHYSLSILLQECGMEKITQRSATDSYIPNWAIYNLDTESDGTVYKPDSLFMEAVKPT